MLNPITDNLWEVRDTLVSFGVHFPLRMTVVRLGDGTLLLHSPVHIDDALAEQLATLGPVAHIVAPNCFHHVHAGSAHARYPDATLHLAPGLAKKRKDLAGQTLSDALVPALAAEFDAVVLGGVPRSNEVVFFHRASRTIILTDLIFNVENPPDSWLTRLVLRLSGTFGRAMQSRLFRLLTRNKALAAESVSRILAWNFERVVLSHGEILADDARNRLEAGLVWMRGVPALSPSAG